MIILDKVPCHPWQGHASDRIAILSKNQSFKFADTCDTVPNLWSLGLAWDITNGKKIDLDASVAG